MSGHSAHSERSIRERAEHVADCTRRTVERVASFRAKVRANQYVEFDDLMTMEAVEGLLAQLAAASAANAIAHEAARANASDAKLYRELMAAVRAWHSDDDDSGELFERVLTLAGITREDEERAWAEKQAAYEREADAARARVTPEDVAAFGRDFEALAEHAPKPVRPKRALTKKSPSKARGGRR